MRQNMAAWQKDMRDMLSRKFSPSQLKDLGLDVDVLAPEKVNPWHDRGFPLAVAWRKKLEQNHRLQNDLLKLGFQRKTLRRAWLGVNEELLADEPNLWGLPPQIDGAGALKQLEIPAGLVLPRFDGPVLNRLLIRPGNPLDPTGDILVQGSADTPLALVLDDLAPAVRVRDE
ncbi:MAG: hypothetical protein HQK55_14980, partial [Deltaproteobacteria bacterium]|nr:hypothetical protein [Deltaproteobacteria bacterium]